MQSGERINSGCEFFMQGSRGYNFSKINVFNFEKLQNRLLGIIGTTYAIPGYQEKR
jgi:hypothetical protein